MRYELYTKISTNGQSSYFYVISSDSFKYIINYIEVFKLTKNSKYIIIDNDAPYPINYNQLGLTGTPSEEEHYKIIYECKIAKEYHSYLTFDFYKDNSINEIDCTLPFEDIVISAKCQTDRYFENYNSKSTM